MAPFNVRANIISPAIIGGCDLYTRQVDKQSKVQGISFEECKKNFDNSMLLKRTGTLEEVAETACFLLGNESGYVNNSEIRIDGGM
eukprot:CAMPEP_0116922408 /NCGR_PEP_ID=MMETSP0467-20121206/22244_1 /TAXON_ID=283647 /ORGANISM="Mesodinium pulex, Strain SPMC105" /LENGTH=85 /DNA_ID=CAMNT_0004600733 /DNA_START=579 /DNA_END=836 /DNA_ORIENTATION=-